MCRKRAAGRVKSLTGVTVRRETVERWQAWQAHAQVRQSFCRPGPLMGESHGWPLGPERRKAYCHSRHLRWLRAGCWFHHVEVTNVGLHT
jgi:hypothetical protein